MDEEVFYCTRPVCRLRSDRSRDRQIFTRRRRIAAGKEAADPLSEHNHLHEKQQSPEGNQLPPGRYCLGLCEIEPPPERTLPGPVTEKALKK
jgi:hypothetical protein